MYSKSTRANRTNKKNAHLETDYLYCQVHKNNTHLNDVVPALFVKDIVATKVHSEEVFRLLDHVLVDDGPDHPAFQDVLQTEEANIREFAPTRFEVAVHLSGTLRILLMMCHLKIQIFKTQKK